MIKQVQPEKLKRGGTIGVVSLGWWAAEGQLYAGVEMLNALGFEVELHDQNFFKDGQMAGTAEERVFAFHEFLNDPDIDAIMLAKGGYGCSQTLRLIDYNLIKKTAKPIIGFSDCTALLNAITAKTGLITYHGPMLSWLPLMENAADSLESFMSVLVEDEGSYLKGAGTSLRHGEGEGVLIGGSMIMFDQLIGTPYLPDLKGQDVILFFEECTPTRPNDVDKFLHHMKNAGLLDKWNVQGVVIESMKGLVDNNIPFGKTIEDIFLGHFKGIPIVANVPCGHGESILTFPIGQKVKLTTSGREVSLKKTKQK